MPGGRALEIETLPLAEDSADALGRLPGHLPGPGLAQGAGLLQHARRGGSLRHRRAHGGLALRPSPLRPLLEPGPPPPPRDRGAVRPGRRRALLCQQHVGTGHRHRLHRRGAADRRAGQCGGLCPAHRARRAPPADHSCGLLLSHAAGGGAAAHAHRRTRTRPDARALSPFGGSAADSSACCSRVPPVRCACSRWPNSSPGCSRLPTWKPSWAICTRPGI